MVTKSNSREFSTEMEDEELNDEFHEQELSNYVSQVIRHLGTLNYKIVLPEQLNLKKVGFYLNFYDNVL